jgi:hypothetical protein
LEGYVVQDLLDLVDKAVFESCKRTGTVESKFSNEYAVIDVRMPLINDETNFFLKWANTASRMSLCST